MSQIEFKYKSSNIIIQCNENDKMKDIIDKFLNKVEKIGEDLFYLYNGSQINYELTFKEQANSIDNKYNQMNVLVFQDENDVTRRDAVCRRLREELPQYKYNRHHTNDRHQDHSSVSPMPNAI